MAEESTLVITVDGESHTVRLSDLSAIDAKDFRAAVGVSLVQAMSEGSADLDVIAGLVWLVRRKRQRGLPYRTVAKAISYTSDVGVEAPEEPDDPDPNDPEA